MKGYKANIEELVANNGFFRQVLYTSKHAQLVLMSLLPSEEVEMEVHENNDQFFRFEKGEGKAVVDGHEYDIKEGDVVIVPAGAMHNIINTSTMAPLKLYTIYSPPHHKDKTVHKNKLEATTNKEEFDGMTSE